MCRSHLRRALHALGYEGEPRTMTLSRTVGPSKGRLTVYLGSGWVPCRRALVRVVARGRGTCSGSRGPWTRRCCTSRSLLGALDRPPRSDRSVLKAALHCVDRYDVNVAKHFDREVHTGCLQHPDDVASGPARPAGRHCVRVSDQDATELRREREGKSRRKLDQIVAKRDGCGQRCGDPDREHGC